MANLDKTFDDLLDHVETCLKTPIDFTTKDGTAQLKVYNDILAAAAKRENDLMQNSVELEKLRIEEELKSREIELDEARLKEEAERERLRAKVDAIDRGIEKIFSIGKAATSVSLFFYTVASDNMDSDIAKRSKVWSTIDRIITTKVFDSRK